MRYRYAFTMIELIFVIVVMGIIGKFGVEFLAQAYKSFIFSKVNNELQQNSAHAVEFIASRLQYRIKDSTIARQTDETSTPIGLGSASGNDYKVLEWVAIDIDNFRADTTPNWSGIIDVDASSAAVLNSPQTDTDKIDTLIQTLSYADSTIADAALYFIGSGSDIIDGYGWNGNLTLINDQNGTMHPINKTGNPDEFQSSTGVNFAGVDLYEYNKIAWTANAIVYEDDGSGKNKGTLTLKYDYQPWRDNGSGSGENYTDGKSALIMENVSTFRFTAIDSIIKIQICVKSDLIEEYSLCKEKTIF